MPSGLTNSGFTNHWQEESGEYLKIQDFRIDQLPAAGVAPGYIVKVGEKFYYDLLLEYTSILGAIGGGVDILINFSAFDLATGTVQAAYSKQMLNRDLSAGINPTSKRWNHTDADFSFTANVPGLYQLTTTVVVPTTGISSFTTGPLLMIFN